MEAQKNQKTKNQPLRFLANYNGCKVANTTMRKQNVQTMIFEILLIALRNAFATPPLTKTTTGLN